MTFNNCKLILPEIQDEDQLKMRVKIVKFLVE